MSRYETFERSRLQLRSLEERGCDLWEPQIAELTSPEHRRRYGWSYPFTGFLLFEWR